jgi:hypothetical protein
MLNTSLDCSRKALPLIHIVSKSSLILAVAAFGLGACSADNEGDPNHTVGGTASDGSASGGVPTVGGIPPAAGGAGSPTGGSAAGGSPGGQSAGGTATAGSAGSASAGNAGSSAGGSGGSSAGGSSAGGSGGSGGSSPNCSPIDPNATTEAKKLLCYIYSIYGKSVLSGQQETSWSNPKADIDYYETLLGKHPAILGGDYLYADGPKPGGNTTQRGIAYWKAGGITMMRYHMGAPPGPDTYDNSKGTVANFDKLTQEGTAENTSLKSKLDYLAGELKVMQDAKVPVLMVPYHEVDKYAWFWWSKCTGAQFITLWKYSIDYINKTRGVHNVLWVMGFGHDGAMADFFPTGFTDLGGIDQYDKGTQPFTNLFNGTKAVVGSTIPIPLHETGTIPQPSAMFPSTAPWVMWNVWATYQNTNPEGYTWNTPESIKSAYADPHTVTRESLPKDR